MCFLDTEQFPAILLTDYNRYSAVADPCESIYWIQALTTFLGQSWVNLRNSTTCAQEEIQKRQLNFQILLPLFNLTAVSYAKCNSLFGFKTLPHFYRNSESLPLTATKTPSNNHRFKDFRPVDRLRFLKPKGLCEGTVKLIQTLLPSPHIFGESIQDFKLQRVPGILVVMISTFYGAYEIGNDLFYFNFLITQCSNMCTHGVYKPLE